ncbi:MAG: hypothetical protein HUU10_10115 [Bacteroidetes bacterium]|nr:hypothetical protein [Bacteroidota bacterium]
MPRKTIQRSTVVLLFGALMVSSFGFGHFQSTSQYRERISALQDSLILTRQSLEANRLKLRGSMDTVTFTSYNPVEGQTDDTPFTTASGSTVDGWTLALSRDMLRPHNFEAEYSYGDTVYAIIPLVVRDTMNKRYARSADILSFSYEVSKWLGRREGYIVKASEIK